MTRGAGEGGGAIRLLLADDHPVVRAGLRAVLDTEPGFRVAGEAATAEEAVALVAAGGFDVVLMDLQFGAGMHGAEATAKITAAPDGPRVLILTTYDSDADILAAVEAGASGYLLRTRRRRSWRPRCARRRRAVRRWRPRWPTG